MRARRNDTFLHAFDPDEQGGARYWRRKFAGPNEPSLYMPDEDSADEEEATFTIPTRRLQGFPTVQEMQAMSANDPLSTILHYNACIKISLGLLNGMRTCRKIVFSITTVKGHERIQAGPSSKL